MDTNVTSKIKRLSNQHKNRRGSALVSKSKTSLSSDKDCLILLEQAGIVSFFSIFEVPVSKIMIENGFDAKQNNTDLKYTCSCMP
ncbi:hypothetical protein L596_001754 [Steinernema carpocapsae]|uniref:Uncharacterized protein n=1 Tax=Steinernema carpocapsae TaxID=34508 RepID=A0A4U8UME8_STECR|nr:hypothetical protein L596_001754 [Steinernema carpocapsae]